MSPLEEVAAVFAREYAIGVGEDNVGALLRSGAFHALPDGVGGVPAMAHRLDIAAERFDALLQQRTLVQTPEDGVFSTVPRPPMTTPCCQMMAEQLSNGCPTHGTGCPDKVVRKGAHSGRFYLVAPNATWTFTFCPWCGSTVQDPDEDQPSSVQVHRHTA